MAPQHPISYRITLETVFILLLLIIGLHIFHVGGLYNEGVSLEITCVTYVYIYTSEISTIDWLQMPFNGIGF